jgi:hypothetical protein
LNGKDGEMPPLKCNVMVKIEVVAKPEGWNHRHVGKEGKIKVVRSKRPTHANGLAQSNGRTVQWDATHQNWNPGARTFFWIYFGIFRRYALSGKRRSRRRRVANGDFENLQICRCSVLRRCSQG